MTDYADLKAKAEATLRAGERTAAEPLCGCEDCGWASVVLSLLAENERLRAAKVWRERLSQAKSNNERLSILKELDDALQEGRPA